MRVREKDLEMKKRDYMNERGNDCHERERERGRERRGGNNDWEIYKQEGQKPPF